MTMRPVSDAPPGSPFTAPGERPHLPPLEARSTTTARRRSARTAPLRWLPWLLLGLLALTLLSAAVLARAAGGEGGSRPAGQGAPVEATAGQLAP